MELKLGEEGKDETLELKLGPDGEPISKKLTPDQNLLLKDIEKSEGPAKFDTVGRMIDAKPIRPTNDKPVPARTPDGEILTGDVSRIGRVVAGAIPKTKTTRCNPNNRIRSPTILTST